MAQRVYRGEKGRPFGTVAALLCLILTLALITLARIAAETTGVATAPEIDPSRLQAVQGYWGLLLASEIVRVVTSGALLLAVWTLARPVAPHTGGNRATLAVGTLAALLLMLAGRQGIVTAAHLSHMEIVPFTPLYAMLARASVLLAGLWAAMLALEARRADSLPRWVRDTGLAFCAAALASFVFAPLLPLAAAVSLVWWGGVFATLHKPEDRLAL